jgi:hypothetical protein
MSNRRDYDGYNDEALTDPTVDCRELITGADFDAGGQIFWLRYIIIRNSHATDDAILEVYDQNEGVAVAINLRFTADLPANATTVIEIPSPGISFYVNITAGLNGATGTVAVGNAHAGGYQVGGME